LGNFIKRSQSLNLFSDANAGKKLLQHSPVLRQRIGGRIMLFDEMAKSGSTLRLAEAIFKRAGARKLTTATMFATKRIAQPFFPGEGIVMLKRPAKVIGRVEKSLKTAEKATYFKRRNLAGANAHLKKLAKHASRPRFRKRKK